MSGFSDRINRRTFVKYLGATAVACPTCMAAANAMASETKKTEGHDASAGEKKSSHGSSHWGYEGTEGPENWGELSPQYSVCGRGYEQSPINLTKAISSAVGGIDVNYKRTPLRVVNNGHTIQVNCDPGSTMSLRGDKFSLLQFHFHHPSEHALDGARFQMEAHFVHASSDGRLAVLGVFIEPGMENSLLAPIWRAMPMEAGPEVKIESTMIKPDDLLPADRSYFRYMGSLTTPPCSQIVNWSVFKQPVQASSAQVGKFSSLFSMNARPLQPLHRRLLLRSQ
ncbi:MAG: carbonic anhydrase family protein [Rhodospirillaceae bacterium]|nr:carbonic anhydrase family protein [Rhodospirillaceae bacterium]